ncbi:hypothetical protein N9B55_00755 [Vicingaceae bacterium]|nr:hypothetical protein [Vicingaceae bacterium]
MNIKHFGFLLLLGLSSLNVSSQARENSSRPSATKATPQNKGFQIEKVVFGGNLSAQFGTITLVHLNPTAGYKLKENWLVGASATYIYLEDKRFRPSYINNIYGGSLFTQFYFLENFIAHAEYERLNIGEKLESVRINVDAFLVGGGYRSQIGSNSFANIMILYNVIENECYPYSNPIIRVGFGIGL